MKLVLGLRGKEEREVGAARGEGEDERKGGRRKRERERLTYLGNSGRNSMVITKPCLCGGMKKRCRRH